LSKIKIIGLADIAYSKKTPTVKQARVGIKAMIRIIILKASNSDINLFLK